MILIALAIPALNILALRQRGDARRLQAFHYLATSLIAAMVTTVLGVTGVLALDWRVDGVFFAGLARDPDRRCRTAWRSCATASRALLVAELKPMLDLRAPARARDARGLGALARRPDHPLAARQPRPGRPVRDRQPAREPDPDRRHRLPVRANAVPVLDLLREPGPGEGGPRPGDHIPDRDPRLLRARADAVRARADRPRRAGLRPVVQGGRPADARRDRLWARLGADDRLLARAEDRPARAVGGRGGGGQHRPQLRAHPALGNRRRRRRDGDRLRRARGRVLHRRAARLPHALRAAEAAGDARARVRARRARRRPARARAAAGADQAARARRLRSRPLADRDAFAAPRCASCASSRAG